MSIILIGYRGSGKTTVGRRLAEELGWAFVDLDEQIVGAAGKSIRQIFEQGGEPAFRRLESEHLAHVVQLQKHVISLGGGAILADSNRRMILEAGHVVVYLKADAEELHRRITADPATTAQRPSLTHLAGSVEEVRSLLAEREVLYQQVKTVEVDANWPVEKIVGPVAGGSRFILSLKSYEKMARYQRLKMKIPRSWRVFFKT